jgi:ArsR family transcriptional regulator
MHFHAMNQHESRSRHILACLGDASRFRIVLSLLERERCVTELAGEVGLSQSCTTRHLQYLEREGLVRGARQGKRVVFRLRSDQARVRELLAWVTAASSAAPRSERPWEGDGESAHPARSRPPRLEREDAGGSRPLDPDPAAGESDGPAEMEDWLL